MKKDKICVIFSTSLSIKTLYVGQVDYLVSHGFDVSVIASPGNEHEIILQEGGRSVPIPIERNPDVVKDFFSLIKVWLHFLSNRYDLIIISTPKASLIGGLAAYFSLHKNVLFVVRGRAYENFTGKKYTAYKFLDKVICSIASNVQFISNEMMESYISEKVCINDKAIVLGSGSSKGVDTSFFSKSNFSQKENNDLKNLLEIEPDDFVWLYCGRVRKDKGINELVKAFLELREKNTKHKLILVGPYEDWDPIENEVLKEIFNNPAIKYIEWSDSIPSYMAISNVFVFPSYREGFGNVAIEASSMELPVIAFNVIGCRESVKHGVSGILLDSLDYKSLSNAMFDLSNDKELLDRISYQGRQWVLTNFDREIVLGRNVDLYKDIIN
ncbi:glycosyltransferase [Psychrobacter sp. GP33]|uniref:glycosyltransferase n=1 Tax=Psychrobacter sp. GP33 TaxID=2758709 RepID=UPI0015FDD318|nr:glycosyltransferase [Psychrobacter sp. GP33]